MRTPLRLLLLMALTQPCAVALGENLTLPKNFPSDPIQALLPFDNRLWIAQKNAITMWERGGGSPTTLSMEGVGGSARLMMGSQTGGVLAGALISASGKAEALPGLSSASVVGVCRHPADHRLCFLTEEGRLLGADVATKEVAGIFENLPKALGLGSHPAHLRALFAAHDRLYLANEANAGQAGKGGGRLAEWDWRGAWRMVDTASFVDVTGIESVNGERENLVLALGYDDLSVLLRVYSNLQWKRYRLPWRERPSTGIGQRIREISPGQWLMLAFGNFYLIQPPIPGSNQPQVRPLSACTESLHDFCAWGGSIVLAGGQQDRTAGTTQPLLRETTLAAITASPRPTGQGAWWRTTSVNANQVSESLLIAGFQKRTVHLSNEGDSPLTVDLEIDANNTEAYRGLYRMQVAPHSYVPYVFPEGYSATWLRLRAQEAGMVTAEISLE